MPLAPGHVMPVRLTTIGSRHWCRRLSVTCLAPASAATGVMSNVPRERFRQPKTYRE